jgi:Uma2 family endonuclease
MIAQSRLFTARDLANMPDDGRIYELRNGVLIEVAGSTLRQSRLAAWIIFLLTTFIEERRLGGAITGSDGTFVLSGFNTRIPDAAYITALNLANQDNEAYIRGAPDLAIEVVSPSNTPLEMQTRAVEYLSAGSQIVWIVNPEQRTVDVYLPDGQHLVAQNDATLSGYDVLPGLALSLSRLFERLDDIR